MNDLWEKAFLVALATSCQCARTVGGAVGDAAAIANESVKACPKDPPWYDGGDVPSVTSGWISVKDRLPDKDGVVLIYAKRVITGVLAECVDTVFYDAVTKGFPVGRCREWLDAITHWMPLPAPPEDAT